MPGLPDEPIPSTEFMTVAQAAKRLPDLSEGQLRARIRQKLIRSVRIAGYELVIERELRFAFGHKFKPAPKK